MLYNVRHSACESNLVNFVVDGPLKTIDELKAYGAACIARDLRKTGGAIKREWPLECDACGKPLTFEPVPHGGGAQQPLLSRQDGVTVFHD